MEADPDPDQPRPAARINGEIVVQWPEDLYIPPDALEVFLESFQGPLDLLLYLIRKQNIDILDIPVAEITRQYMEYVELMRRLRLDLAAEYLVMAAMLAEIKSRMLLPRQSPDDGEEEDPRLLLVQRLQEYERYRDAALDLDGRPRLERELFVAFTSFTDEDYTPPDPDVDIDALVNAFENVIENAIRNRRWHISREVLSVRERMSRILDRLNGATLLRFEQLFDFEEGRMGLVVTFVAILELLKENMLTVVQNEPFAAIHVRAVAG